MKILFCGIAISSTEFNNMANALGSMPFAEQKLETSILKGFDKNEENNNVFFLSTPPYPRYPKWRKILIKAKMNRIENIDGRCLGFINLPFIKQIFELRGYYINIKKWLKNNSSEDKTILCYSTKPLCTIPALWLKKRYDFNLVTYMSELDYLRNIKNKYKKKALLMVSNRIEDRFDGYIYASKYMAEHINKSSKPEITIEGMTDGVKTIDIVTNTMSSKKIVLYAGSIEKKYGIDKVVNCFQNMNTDDYTLRIYGTGSYSDELAFIAKDNKNIEYCGVAKNDVILQEEKDAYLLINPRPSNEILTRYSFPSKTIEYMESGTPCLLTKLKGIPDEYYNHCFTINDETAEGMNDTIKSILHYPINVIENVGKDARKFVLKEKDCGVQVKKIITFIKQIGDIK